MKRQGDFVLKIVLCAFALFAVLNYGVVNGYLHKFFDVLQPVVLGVVLALALAVPLHFFENKVFRKIKKEKLKRFLSLALTVLLFAGVVALMLALVVPQAVKGMSEAQMAEYTKKKYGKALCRECATKACQESGGAENHESTEQ